MKTNVKTQVAAIEATIASFKKLALAFPEAGLEATISKLQTQRAELVSTIGKR